MNRANIITPETRQLVASVEEDYSDDKMSVLVNHLAERCQDPAVRSRYESYMTSTGEIDAYPLDAEGYAKAFDPLEEESALYETWEKYGVVVAKEVVPDELCVAAIKKVHDTLSGLSEGKFDLTDRSTHDELPVDAEGVPMLTRGFFELYHDDALAQLRQSLRLYLHHVIVWGRADLWTTFDRFGVKLPGHAESAALPLHVDQNPTVHPGFKTTQGVLALEDCPVERGTIVVAPGSKKLFEQYAGMARSKGEYVQLETDSLAEQALRSQAKPLPIRKGNIVTWDSRTTHANSANISDQTRFIALISAGPAPERDDAARLARSEAFESGLGLNVRGALMHASMRPRYTNETALATIRKPEQLSLLGKLLYGQVRYDQI